MKTILTFGVVFLLLVFSSTVFAQEGFANRPITNNLWTPTGYTLNKGEFTVGIGPIGFGVTDNVQVGTNVLLFLFQVPNANLKFNVSKSSTSAFGVGVDLLHFSLDIFDGNNDESFTVFSPYASFTNNIGDKTSVHISGQYSFFASDADIDDAEAESSSLGTSVSGGIEYSFSGKTKFLADIGYDATFEGLRLGGGVLFGWTKFRLKLGVAYFNPAGVGDFTLPQIGLWWRFRG